MRGNHSKYVHGGFWRDSLLSPTSFWCDTSIDKDTMRIQSFWSSVMYPARYAVEKAFDSRWMKIFVCGGYMAEEKLSLDRWVDVLMVLMKAWDQIFQFGFLGLWKLLLWWPQIPGGWYSSWSFCYHGGTRLLRALFFHENQFVFDPLDFKRIADICDYNVTELELWQHKQETATIVLSRQCQKIYLVIW